MPSQLGAKAIFSYFTFSATGQSQLIAAFALSETNEVPDDKISDYKSMGEIKSETLTTGPATNKFIELGEDLYRNMFVRNMGNFETYLSDIFSSIYSINPSMLKSKETITLEEVLQFDDKDDLIKYH